MSENRENIADPGETAGSHNHFTGITGISHGPNPANAAPPTTGPGNENSYSNPYTRRNYQDFIAPGQVYDGLYSPASHANGRANNDSPSGPPRAGEVNINHHTDGGQLNTGSHMGGVGQVIPNGPFTNGQGYFVKVENGVPTGVWPVNSTPQGLSIANTTFRNTAPRMVPVSTSDDDLISAPGFGVSLKMNEFWLLLNALRNLNPPINNKEIDWESVLATEGCTYTTKASILVGFNSLRRKLGFAAGSRKRNGFAQFDTPVRAARESSDDIVTSALKPAPAGVTKSRASGRWSQTPISRGLEGMGHQVGGVSNPNTIGGDFKYENEERVAGTPGSVSGPASRSFGDMDARLQSYGEQRVTGTPVASPRPASQNFGESYGEQRVADAPVAIPGLTSHNFGGMDARRQYYGEQGSGNGSTRPTFSFYSNSLNRDTEAPAYPVSEQEDHEMMSNPAPRFLNGGRNPDGNGPRYYEQSDRGGSPEL